MSGSPAPWAVGALARLYRRLVSRDNHYFKVGIIREGTDLVYLYHSLTPVRDGLSRAEKTIIIDLSLDADSLWNALSYSTKYAINRATREGIRFDASSTNQSIDAFLLAQRELQNRKGLSALGLSEYRRLLSAHRLFITGSTSDAGEPISWHVYRKDESRARLMHSVTILSTRETPAQRTFAGRANRFHHWHDILFFKEAGLKCIDLGGWSGDESKPELQGIDRFKQNFGGSIFDVYDAIIPRSALGRLEVFIRRLFRR